MAAPGPPPVQRRSSMTTLGSRRKFGRWYSGSVSATQLKTRVLMPEPTPGTTLSMRRMIMYWLRDAQYWFAAFALAIGAWPETILFAVVLTMKVSLPAGTISVVETQPATTSGVAIARMNLAITGPPPPVSPTLW